ncbi:MAG: hypothetical protein N3G18_01810 [Candidatus Saccharicenans sp.]|nr:hypothetical protein [Candidatus Saccharicenans sp.]
MLSGLKAPLIITAILLTLSSCLVVAVEKTESQADLEWQNTRHRVMQLSLHSSSSDRPHRLKMLVYDPNQAQLLRISLPFWLIKKGLKPEDANAARPHDQDFEFDMNGFGRAVGEMPPGFLAEVMTDRERVLLWLE